MNITPGARWPNLRNMFAQHPEHLIRMPRPSCSSTSGGRAPPMGAQVLKLAMRRQASQDEAAHTTSSVYVHMQNNNIYMYIYMYNYTTYIYIYIYVYMYM